MSRSRNRTLGRGELRELLPWLSEAIGITLDPFDQQALGQPPQVAEPVPAPAFLAGLRATLGAGQISTDPLLRLRHGHGHGVEELHAVNNGGLQRVPDYIVYPEEEREVARIVELAHRHDVCLVPFGGGTNDSGALRCPPGETRAIVSVDMQRMNRIVWIDPDHRTACIQAGAMGRTFVAQLEKYGFTIGHEAGSARFSTLGGWIAANASGMTKIRHGKIQDIVLELTAVTPTGRLERRHAVPRESIGLDPKQWLLGSDGSLGTVTSAVVKTIPVPAVRKYGSALFHTFDRGFAFLYDLRRLGNVPASVRLVDNLQFQFSQALEAGAKGLYRIKRPLETWLVLRPFGFDVDKMVACTFVFEGTRRETEAQEKAVYRLANQYKGFPCSPEKGQARYQLPFDIAFSRDFFIGRHILAGTMETSAGWSDAQPLCANVKQRVHERSAQRGLPGRPLISCRVTQLYPTGVTIEFSLAFYAKGVPDAVQVYRELEHEACAEISKAGGMLATRGAGKICQGFLPAVLAGAAFESHRREPV